MRGSFDLHLHSTASDGQYTPRELVEMALAGGLEAMALTDHDSTEGVEQALEAARGTPLEVIPGVEISAEVGHQEAHLLGYYIDHHYPPLQKRLKAIREYRRCRAKRILEKLGRLGMPLRWERVTEIAGPGSVGRPHIAQAMMEEGYISSSNEAFLAYIGRGRPAYVPRYKISPLKATQMILEAQGFPVVAHPLEVLDLIPHLVAAGLVGLEAYYGQYSPEEVREVVSWTEKYGLIPTGGSDFHGQAVLETPSLGEVWVPEGSLRRLRALAEAKRGD